MYSAEQWGFIVRHLGTAVQCRNAGYSAGMRGTVQNSVVSYSWTVGYCAGQCRAVGCSGGQYRTAVHRTGQCSAAGYSAGQCKAAMYSAGQCRAVGTVSDMHQTKFQFCINTVYDIRMRSCLVRMRSSLVRMRSSLVRMRSSLVADEI